MIFLKEGMQYYDAFFVLCSNHGLESAPVSFILYAAINQVFG